MSFLCRHLDDGTPVRAWDLAPTVTVRAIERFPAGWDLVLDDDTRLTLWDEGYDSPPTVPEYGIHK